MNKKIIIGMVVVLGALGYLALAGFQEGKAYYKTIEELQAMGDGAVDKRLRVAGIVTTGSIKRDGTDLVFKIEQEERVLNVVYTGSSPVPDTFKDGSEALCDGYYKSDGTFEATSIQAKCASKYEAEYKTAEH